MSTMIEGVAYDLINFLKERLFFIWVGVVVVYISDGFMKVNSFLTRE